MFRLEYWPYSGFLLLVSTILSLCVLAITWFLKRNAREDLAQYYKNMVLRSLTLFIVSAMLYVIPIAVIVKAQYWDNDELAQIAVRFATHPDDEDCRKQYEHYLKTHTPSGKLIQRIDTAKPVDKAMPARLTK
jgi:hypothetical protein